MRRLLGPEYSRFLASYDHPPSSGLRVNTLKLSPVEFQAFSPFQLAPISWCPSGFRLYPKNQEIPTQTKLQSPNLQPVTPGRHPFHAAGLYYLQEPSAMAVVELLDPQPGDRVLDLAAAPGGKSTHIASKLMGEGLLVANEVHPKRAWELAENLERWGVRNAVILNESAQQLAQAFGNSFDRVLLDAPCSGEGLFRRNPAARGEWSPAAVERSALRQDELLRVAARLVRPGGRLVYSTCTFAPEEDEGAIAKFLDDHQDFKLLAVPPDGGYAKGRADWVEGHPKQRLDRAVRLWPHLAPGEGHFIAVLQQVGGPGGQAWKPARPRMLPTPALQAWREFASETLQISFDEGRLSLVGSYLYDLPSELPDLGGIYTIHPGWWLGTFKKDRLEPSHALALALRKGEANRYLDLSSSGSEVFAYLRGETLLIPGESGWVLVTVDGFPLGWGKRVGGVVKNFYPKGLRYL